MTFVCKTTSDGRPLTLWHVAMPDADHARRVPHRLRPCRRLPLAHRRPRLGAPSVQRPAARPRRTLRRQRVPPTMGDPMSDQRTTTHHKPTRPTPGPNFEPSPLVRRKLAEMRPRIAAVKRAMQNGSGCELDRVREALEEVTRIVMQESENHRFGSRGYDMTLDHLHDVAESCREVLYPTENGSDGATP